MKSLTISVVMLFLGAGLVVHSEPACAQSQHASASHATTTIGMIGDTICGRKHIMGEKSDAECTRECVQRGSKYALIAGERVYILEDGPLRTLDRLAGSRVLVLGAVDGDTIWVKSITAEHSSPRTSKH